MYVYADIGVINDGDRLTILVHAGKAKLIFLLFNGLLDA